MTSEFAIAMNAITTTWNGALSLSTPDCTGKTDGRLSVFYKAVRGMDKDTLNKYMEKAYQESKVDAFLLAFNTRDCRGGKGERTLGRLAFVWLFLNHPDEFRKIMHLIPVYGRWDDMFQFFPNVSVDEHDIVLDRYVNLQEDCVKIMSEQLKSDYKNMLDGKPCSLCSKWAPTEKDSMDKMFGTYGTLARIMKISPRTLRKTYLTPLRSYIKVVEKFMCNNEWDKIEYSKVPSQAMRRLKKSFAKRDEHRFEEWKNALSSGATKVCGKQLHPHELIKEVRRTKTSDEVCEAQWKVLEEEVMKMGSLTDCLIIVDTSSSMHEPNFLPFDVATAMGILVSGSIVNGPFKHMVITFNTVPKFIEIKNGSLLERWKQVTGIEWGGTTNFQSVFAMILMAAKQANLSPENMPKKVITVSDMQFNQAGNLTNIQAIDEQYKNSGYKRPDLIFWNVNGESSDFPISVGDHGTALISGFSPEILRSVITGTEFSPISVLRATLDTDRLKPIKDILEQ